MSKSRVTLATNRRVELRTWTGGAMSWAKDFEQDRCINTHAGRVDADAFSGDEIAVHKKTRLRMPRPSH
jgi:hypothetical protein